MSLEPAPVLDPAPTCIAFEGARRIASGPLDEVALKAKRVLDRGERGPVLLFDAVTSELVEVDFRGTAEDVARRLARRRPAPPAAEPPRGPGRPKLGVVAREVTLLPRHWDWLGGQPGGASVTLRRLVEDARRASAERDRQRLARESAYRFMSAMAGDRPGFEEATRAFFAGDRRRFLEHVAGWPVDVREHAVQLADVAFAG
jgi:hypothetical protein